MKVAKLSSLLFLPLALCSAVPEAKSNVIAQKTDQEQVSIKQVGQDMSDFVGNVQRIADDALASYNAKVPDWPNNVQELLKLADAQLVDAETSLRVNPIQDIINGVFGAINQVTGLVNSVTSKIPDSITIGDAPGTPNATDPNPIGTLLTSIGHGLDGLVSEFTNGSFTNVGGLVNSLINGTGNALEGLTDGVVTNEWVNKTVDFVSSSVGDLVDGKKDIVQVLTEGLTLLSRFTGANNPLGKFIQNVAIFLSTHPNGIVANTIKFTTFVNAAVFTLTTIIRNVAVNLGQAASNAFKNAFVGILKSLFGDILGLRRLATSNRATTAVTTSYTQLIVEILNKIVQKLFTMDPYILSVLTEPSEGNIRRFILEIAKVLTDHNA